MLEINKLVPPSAEQWDIVIDGMRNAFKSWDKGDSAICTDSDELKDICFDCPFVDSWEDEAPYSRPVCGIEIFDVGHQFILGKNDKKLLFGLCELGTSDRKVLRQLPVIMNITATGTWWRQMDQYKVGTVTNSTSQMHTLLKKPFDKSDFSFDRLPNTIAGRAYADNIIEELNEFREAYFKMEDEEIKKLVWRQIFEMIPQSFNYFRTWSGNYEVLVTIFQQRFNHDQKEWNVFLAELYHRLPYYGEILEALGLIRIKSGKVEGYDSYHKKWSYLCEE